MRGSTHAVIGANAVWIPVLFGAVVQPWMFLIAACAALLPDLDASESMIKHARVGGYIGHVRVGFKPFAPIAMIVSAAFGHRGPLHSLLAVALVCIASVFLIPYITVIGWWMIVLGYFSHLLADALTKSGIEFFWPIRIRFGILPKGLRFRTGGFVDTLLLILGSGGVLLFLSTWTFV